MSTKLNPDLPCSIASNGIIFFPTFGKKTRNSIVVTLPNLSFLSNIIETFLNDVVGFCYFTFLRILRFILLLPMPPLHNQILTGNRCPSTHSFPALSNSTQRTSFRRPLLLLRHSLLYVQHHHHDRGCCAGGRR